MAVLVERISDHSFERTQTHELSELCNLGWNSAVHDFLQWLLLVLLPLCMKVNLTGHNILVTLSLESLLIRLSPGIAEVWGQPNFCSHVGFIFLLGWFCVYPYNFWVGNTCLKQNWIQCITPPKCFSIWESMFLFFFSKILLSSYSSVFSFMIGKLLKFKSLNDWLDFLCHPAVCCI